MELILKAREFAEKAHAGVYRKGSSGELYFKHPERVAAALAAVGLPEAVVAAGYLHDVVEDTPITSAEIAAEFGVEVAALVAEVTKPVLPKEPGNKAWRKAKEAEHLKAASYYGASIKLADIADNAVGMELVGPDFVKRYKPELFAKLAIVSHGHPELLAKAKAILSK